MRLYFDTSVFSAYYDERTPERLQATREFWNTLKLHELICSTLTTDELSQAEQTRAEQFTALLRGFRVVTLTIAMRDLANAYVSAGVVPTRYLDDALHIAAATCGDADVLVSWNFKHLVKRNTRLLVSYSIPLQKLSQPRGFFGHR
ncbi:MAG: type II toxin-antitoxin system VapC family toxin [Chloroflexi bacterium]|nr:type II toxin-antitoxin system VapC family toxin [Chloroflexota bacterium]